MTFTPGCCLSDTATAGRPGTIWSIYGARQIWEGLPKARLAAPVEFFKDLEQNGVPDVTYVGELYFAVHRGTYTSQARTKRGNRRIVTTGPLVAQLAITRRLHHSPMTQIGSLRRGSHRVEFQTRLDWRERHKLLKVNFPVNINATEAMLHYGKTKGTSGYATCLSGWKK
jgi:alpha-mannosidase